MSDRPSPRVSGFSWGRVEVEGEGVFKDAKLYPGGAREWDWRETGTRHAPGVQPIDAEELLERGATVVVLGSREAVKHYNELAAREPAAALIHSTC